MHATICSPMSWSVASVLSTEALLCSSFRIERHFIFIVNFSFSFMIHSDFGYVLLFDLSSTFCSQKSYTLFLMFMKLGYVQKQIMHPLRWLYIGCPFFQIWSSWSPTCVVNVVIGEIRVQWGASYWRLSYLLMTCDGNKFEKLSFLYWSKWIGLM